MKKIFFGALLLSAVTLSTQAQISAGTKLLTGSVGYRQQKSEASDTSTPGNRTFESKQSQFNFNPSIGYFIADNLALGVSAGIVASRYDVQENFVNINGPISIERETKGRTLSVGVFGRYYKFVNEKMALYGQLGGGYQNFYDSTKQSIGAANSNSNRQEGLYANLLPGIVFFPTNKLGLELTLRGISYNRQTYGNASGSQSIKNSAFDFGFGLNDLNLGISLYLGRN